MVFKNGVKNIQAVGYNGARTVDLRPLLKEKEKKNMVYLTIIRYCFRFLLSLIISRVLSEPFARDSQNKSNFLVKSFNFAEKRKGENMVYLTRIR
jgi:hypothetical protein